MEAEHDIDIVDNCADMNKADLENLAVEHRIQNWRTMSKPCMIAAIRSSHRIPSRTTARMRIFSIFRYSGSSFDGKMTTKLESTGRVSREVAAIVRLLADGERGILRSSSVLVSS